MRSFLLTVLALALVPLHVNAQVIKFTREQLIKYTAENPYDRFPDGRPKVPDSILEKFKTMSMEEVMLGRRGYPNQYVGDLKVLNPGKMLIGRAFTLQFMPERPDMSGVIQADWKATGATRIYDHQIALDMLQPGDVLVVDGYGAVPGIVGDNLAYYIWKKTGTGFVFDGGIRDLEGIAMYDMPAYYRFSSPPPTNNTMVMGVNIPVRIGNTTVMPGDIVFGDREGVTFVPPQLAKACVDAAAVTRVHDEWTRKKFDEGKYKSTDIYSRPTDPALIKEYEEYLKQKLGEEGYQEYLQQQRAFQRGPGQAPAQKKQ
jgi:regulator of RNase E activity RraA